MIDFYPLLHGYREYLTVHNFSKITIKFHLWRLNRFIRFLDQYPINTIQDISSEHIAEYQRYRYYYRNRYGRRDLVSVQNQHLGSMKSFFSYLKREGYIIRNPVEGISYGKQPRRLPKTVLTNQEMKKLLSCPDTKTLLGYRDRTILEVLYSTGIRKKELLNLQVDDVDYREGYVRVNQGKGNKDRIVPLGKIACKYVESYIKGIRILFFNAREQTGLFLSKKGYPIARNTLDELIKKHARKLSLEKQVSSHTFRRTCATEMIKNKANLMHVKDLLGHSSMDTVQVYCNLSIVDLKEAHQKYHPREKDM